MSSDILKMTVTGYKHPIFIRQNTSDVDVYKDVITNGQYGFITSQEPKVIVDAGGNIGLTSVYFAEKYPNAKIITIEPEENNFKLLKKNTENYPNIIAINAALWNNESEIELLEVGLDNWGFMTGDGSKYDKITTPKIEKKNIVKTVTIESLFRDYEINLIDILKIDIEGAEKEVFSACGVWIKNVRSIITELHERMKKGCVEAFAKIVKEFDEISGHSEDIYLSKDGFIKVKNMLKTKNTDNMSLLSLYKLVLKRTIKKVLGKRVCGWLK